MNASHSHRCCRTHPCRNGAALVICVFFIFIVTTLVVTILDTETVELTAVHNSIDYERALYLANAGLHAAAAEIEAVATWRGTITSGSFPANDTYTATAVDGANHTVTVTAQGASGGVIRTVAAAIEL